MAVRDRFESDQDWVCRYTEENNVVDIPLYQPTPSIDLEAIIQALRKNMVHYHGI